MTVVEVVGEILAQTKKSSPKVCLVPTASGDSDNGIRRFYESFTTLDCTPRHLALFQRLPGEGLVSFVLDQDVIYVGGGSTRNMLAVWRGDWIASSGPRCNRVWFSRV